MPHSSLKYFFADCPWLNVPQHRQALIVEESIQTRGRLLGGSAKPPKMTKLAALAAKRRQQESQKSSSEDADQAVSIDYNETLKKLQISRPAKETRSSATNEELPEAKEVDLEAQDVSMADMSQEEVEPEQDLRGAPSTFGSLLTHTTEPGHASIPFNETAPPKFDFSQPSPDDVISKAQRGR